MKTNGKASQTGSNYTVYRRFVGQRTAREVLAALIAVHQQEVG